MISSPEVMKLMKGRLVVSCQAPAGDAFAQPALLSLFARAAVNGGAAAIRTEGADTVRSIKAATAVPVIGLCKRMMPDGIIMITPTNDDARDLVAAGADIIAIDCTSRGQRLGALERIQWIHAQLHVPVWADIATVDEAVAAANAGADAVLSTLRGYTEETAHVLEFEASFIASLVKAVSIPVIAEGRINSIDHVSAALSAGAFSIVVGTAITRPEEITRRFAMGMESGLPRAARHFIGIDLGGTNIKSGISSGDGVLLLSAVTTTPALAGRATLLATLIGIARGRIDDAGARGIKPEALGIATAGWVDPRSGRVLYATENLPGWGGVELGREMEDALGLPVAVENDGNAQAIAEREYGAGRGVDNFVCVTLGTGVGGGCYVNGKLNHGAHFFANGIGHMIVEHDGVACTCGRRGCLEAYTNSSALLNYGNGAWTSAEDLIASANRGDSSARRAVETHAAWVGAGCVSIHNILDPELIVLSGGLAQKNPLLLKIVEEQLQSTDRAWKFRPMRVAASDLGYFGGVLGATAVAHAASLRHRPVRWGNQGAL
jgi:predicted NBD/HSP70 family sugar kinase/putative N-acetylmannosamine-6-phosphate epimerase